MAYDVAHSLIQTINRILNLDDQRYPISDEGKKQILNHGDQKYPISDEGKQKIKQLLDKIKQIKQFLEKFPKEAMSLETRIREAANQVEDVMEHFMYEHIRWQHKSARLAAIERPLNRTEILYDFRELKIVMKEIISIAEEMAVIKPEGAQHGGGPATSSSSTTRVPVIDNATVGLEELVEKIKGSLCGQPSSVRQIIPITGMGGIGKTTLARTVYDDDEVVINFPLRAWIVVSQNYKTENVFADLLYSLEKHIEQGLVKDSDPTEDKLHKILTLKKYLIVVDDLWSTKAWDDIKKAFGDPKKRDGSRIMVTTRNEDVASHASPSTEPHKMELMDKHKSWDLLKLKVFPNIDLPSDMEKIARDIAVGCGGLPLAIVLIAGILSNVDKNPDAWGKIAKDVNAAVEGAEEFGNRISLSYTYLPLHLRPCFLYMSGFPEDHEIRISKLIKLWIAEGFVRDEEEAQGYLNNLVRRNLPLITNIKSNGKFKICNIHDLVRDMSKSKALDENYERRLSIGHLDLTRLARAYASTLRSVLSFQPNESSLGGLRKFKLLRVLDVVDTEAYSLPAPVFELFHLRYLAFGCPMEVPPAISRLQNLRALIVRPSKRLRRFSNDEIYLPLEIWMMPLLTHLVSYFDLLPDPKQADSALKELLTLSVVKKLICTKEMMELIPNVKKLAITYFGDRYQEDYQLNNLKMLHQLEKLTLVVTKGSLLQLKANPVFPKTLKKLTLSGWRFPWEDMKAIAALPDLQVLKLRDHAFEGHTWDTGVESDEEIDEESDEESDEENDEDSYEEAEEQFPKLEYLLIEESDLEKWVTEKRHFPALKRLVLDPCRKLKEIPNAIGNILALKLIEVDRRNKSLLECVQRIHEEQKGYGRLLQVRRL